MRPIRGMESKKGTKTETCLTAPRFDMGFQGMTGLRGMALGRMHIKPAKVLGFLLLIDLRAWNRRAHRVQLAVGGISLRKTRNNNKKATERKKLYFFSGAEEKSMRR